jgi:SAM-dependent methyltransferase
VSGPNWEERYRGDAPLPWDSGRPDHHLVELVERGTIPPGSTLEIGCGTGTNARWLASRGFDVLAVDLAPTAVERARAKGEVASCRFEVADFMTERPDGAPFEFVFDRGCFHVFDEAVDQTRFAARVAELLAPGGIWLSLIGSTEGAPRDVGPPRRNAREIIAAIEPALELVELRTSRFFDEPDKESRAWVCLARRRTMPAQPSTRFADLAPLDADPKAR